MRLTQTMGVPAGPWKDSIMTIPAQAGSSATLWLDPPICEDCHCVTQWEDTRWECPTCHQAIQ